MPIEPDVTRPATLQDVAALARVSPRTVSNVVNGYASVTPKTRARVERAVAEFGYQPNLAARRLARGEPDTQEPLIDLPKLPPGQLVATVEDPDQPLAGRLAAGAMLGMLSDPRLPQVPDLVEVRGGDFWQGTDEIALQHAVQAWRHLGVRRSWLAKETPAHRVRVTTFLLGRYPVTNSQYRAFLTATGYPTPPTTWYLGAYPWDRANHPVAGITPADAAAYLSWLRGQTDRPFRLPSESEWEFAARSGDDREYPWGDNFDSRRANLYETGIHTTTPVGAFPGGRTAHGIHDMAGNVEEFVADDYAPYPGGPAPDEEDDLVRTFGTYRITRGGSFARYGDLARTRRRHGPYPAPEHPIGMRVACNG